MLQTSYYKPALKYSSLSRREDSADSTVGMTGLRTERISVGGMALPSTEEEGTVLPLFPGLV